MLFRSVSAYVYGHPSALPVSEQHPLNAHSPYTQTKILAEEISRFYALHHDVPVAIVRPFNIYGPGQDDRFLIPTLVRQALDPSCDAITVEDLRPRRDYLHVDDLVGLLQRTLPPATIGTYNAGSGRSWSIEELVGIINNRLAAPKTLRSVGHFRPLEVPDVIADITCARRELGWAPTINLPKGIDNLLSGASSATLP